MPEEARTGSRSHPIVFDKYWFMLSMLKLSQNDVEMLKITDG
jgi:hypothetical protein